MIRVLRCNPGLVFLFFVLLCKFTTSDIPRPRGVSLSRATLYSSDKNFTCFDGSKTIPFTHVNDDYCDCPDASDEPGTHACPDGIFHCVNVGHRPLNIPSNRVNDGICDCCDGSDEYDARKTCVNTCIELGRAARDEALKMAELMRTGKQLKGELSQQGLQIKETKKNQLQELMTNKAEAEKLRDEKEAIKKAVEEVETSALEYYRKLEEEMQQKRIEAEAEKNKQEAIEHFNKLDSNQNGLLEVPELQAVQSFDKDRNGEVSKEEADYFLNNQESVDVETFLENSWQLMKPFLIMDSGLYKAPKGHDKEDAHLDSEDAQEQDPDEEHEETEQDEDLDEEQPEEQTEQHQEDSEKEPISVTYDEETQKIVEKATEARREFTDAETNVKNIENEIKNIQEYLEIDFGPDEEFAPLKGQCFEYADHEYIYKLCPFEKTIQQPKSTSSETRLGVWNKWSGPDNNIYKVMLYDRGQSCWNGPQRSTTVNVKCGGESKVVSVSEPNRCEYLFEFITPAACQDAEINANSDMHDEL